MKKSMVLILFAVFAFAATSSLHAQLDGSPVAFKAPFPFYAENTLMPAGNYRIVQESSNSSVLLLENADGKHAAFVDVIPTQSLDPHQNSGVRFKRLGDRQYLSNVWVAGEQMGVELDPTRQEKQLEISAGQQ